MRRTSKGLCFLCEANPAIDTHHIYPVEHGGADDGPKVDLCKNCHDRIHRLAGEVWAKQIALSSIADKNTRQLVTAIHNQHVAFVQNGGVAPDARRRVVAELTPDEQTMLRLIKNHHGFSNQEQVLKALIRREADRIQGGAAPRQAKPLKTNR